jgi:hypothetical protein
MATPANGGPHDLPPGLTPCPAPATFDEAFRLMSRKKVGGGPKTTAADEFLFCGNLGSGLIYLRSRVRLREPNESFYTGSNHRLRDSFVGSGGHWVDIEILGACSDDELALIARLARAADTWPVRAGARPRGEVKGK